MFTVYFFNKLGFEGLVISSNRALARVTWPIMACNPFGPRTRTPSPTKKISVPKPIALILGGVLGGRTGQVRGWSFFFRPHR
jgi:hypothetical protein